MDAIKILIVDDNSVNRTLLVEICRSMDEFEIKEAQDGVEAIDLAEQWHPHIILMDIIMPRLDGLAAAKIIKKMAPEIIIIAVTAQVGRDVEEQIRVIGINASIHKPINKNLIRYKLQSFSGLFDFSEGKNKALSKNLSLNLFGVQTRHFKTTFEIINIEAMMDFGMWVLARCENKATGACLHVDATLELFYQLMNYGLRHGTSLSMIVEESFEDTFVTMKFEKALHVKEKMNHLLEELGSECIIRDNVVSIRFPMGEIKKTSIEKQISKPVKEPIEAPALVESAFAVEPKKIRALESEEQKLLRQSFVKKTSAVEYVNDIGGDVLDEIRDLESLDVEWKEKLQDFEIEPSIDNMADFGDNVLNQYIRAINTLFEFTALAYALSALAITLKEHTQVLVDEPQKLKTLIILLEALGEDLATWRHHIFELQDTADIHYLDSSFFSSCMQIEAIITQKDIETDDDDGFELF